MNEYELICPFCGSEIEVREVIKTTGEHVGYLYVCSDRNNRCFQSVDVYPTIRQAFESCELKLRGKKKI